MSESVSIRMATLHDGDGVTGLLGLSYPTLMRDAYDDAVLDSVLPWMTVAQPALLRSGSYYVAEATAGIIVGCGGWTKERPGSGKVRPRLGHIRHFAVHPDWTRQRIGQRIYARCVEQAKSSGIETFECYSSLNGEAFYAALGFESTGRIDVEMSGGVMFPGIRMLADIRGDTSGARL